MVVFHRIFGALTGLLVAALVAASGAVLLMPPRGLGPNHPQTPVAVQTTRAPAVQAPAHVQDV